MTSPEKPFTGLPIIIVAYGENGEIGKDGQMPWPKMPADLRHFKASTLGHTVIMGRKTYDSIGRALPERRNIVVSRDPDLRLKDAEVFGSPEEALDECIDDDEIFVIGGGELYRRTMPLARIIVATEIDSAFEGSDTFFEKPTAPEWVEETREHHDKDGSDPFDYDFVTYKSNKLIVDLNKALNRPKYLDELRSIEASGLCPFCEMRFTQNEENELIDEGNYWTVTQNYNPYEGTSRHLMLVPKRHIERPSQLGPRSQLESQQLINKYTSEMNAGGVAYRFGQLERTGASVAHLHIHIMELTEEPVTELTRFKIG